MIMLLKYIGKDFMKMQSKWFYYENAIEIILRWKCNPTDILYAAPSEDRTY